MNPPLNQLQNQQNKELFFNTVISLEQQVMIQETVFKQVVSLLGEEGNLHELKSFGEQLTTWIHEGIEGLYLASYWLDNFITQVSEQVIGSPHNPFFIEASVKHHQAYITEDGVYVLLFGLNGLKVPRSFSPNNFNLEGLINNPLRQLYFKFFLIHLKREIFSQMNTEQMKQKYDHYHTLFEQCYQMQEEI